MRSRDLLSALALALAACTPSTGSTPSSPVQATDPTAIKAQAAAALQPFKAALKSELTAALQTSPTAAIEVCAKRAPALAVEHSKGAVRVGRTSARLRSSKNAAPAWAAPLLTELATLPSGSSESKLVALGGGRWGYVEPIWTQPMCVTCHGATLAPEVEATLKDKYPDDRARGFSVGDLRGAFLVELADRGR